VGAVRPDEPWGEGDRCSDPSGTRLPSSIRRRLEHAASKQASERGYGPGGQPQHQIMWLLFVSFCFISLRQAFSAIYDIHNDDTSQPGRAKWEGS
jgi:hypothetical protein